MLVHLTADTLVTDVFRDFSHRAASNDLATPDGSISSPLFGSPKLDSDVFESSVNSLDESMVTKSGKDSAQQDVAGEKDGSASANKNMEETDGLITFQNEDDMPMPGESTV